MIISISMQIRSVEVAKTMHDEGRGFLRSYMALTMISVRLKKHEFPLKPKYHATYPNNGEVFFLQR